MKHETQFRLELVTQEKVLLSQEVSFVVVPSGRGPIGILPGHAPLLGVITVGILKVRDTAQKEFDVFVRRGFFMVSRTGVTVVTQSAEVGNSIDLDRALEARERAEKIIATRSPGMDMERAREALTRAKTRIKIVQGAPSPR